MDVTMSSKKSRPIRPLDLLLHNTDTKIILLLLNTPLPRPEMFSTIWKKAVLKLCADGGSNRLSKLQSTVNTTYIPDAIVGDLDSITNETKSYYLSKGVKICHTPDQDETDFTKTIRKALEISNEKDLKYDAIVALSSFSGRPDHQLSNYRSLYVGSKLQDKPIYLFSDDSYATVLLPGEHSISTDTGYEGDWCSLVPLNGSANHVATSGLKWNLDNQPLSLSEMWSTSNELSGSKQNVYVKTDNVILWCAGYKISF